MKSRLRGAIYHHKNLVYHNGVVGKKYLILLNSPEKDDPYLFLKTTSQQKDKPLKPGCIKERSIFFIPKNTMPVFFLDTWIQLHEIYEFSPDVIGNNRDITHKGSLNTKAIDDVVNCLFDSEEKNISGFHKNLLRPPLQASLLKLQEKFNRKN